MGSRKVNTEGIDEELLLASIGRRTQDGTLRPAQEVPATAPTEDDTAVPEPPPAQPVARERTHRPKQIKPLCFRLHRRTGAATRAARGTGENAEGRRSPEKAGRGL